MKRVTRKKWDGQRLCSGRERDQVFRSTHPVCEASIDAFFLLFVLLCFISPLLPNASFSNLIHFGAAPSLASPFLSTHLNAKSWKVGLSSCGSQLTRTPFYKRGCQDKQLSCDWKGSRHPALRCDEVLWFHISLDSSSCRSDVLGF
jgi:hypothetical protein